MRKGLTGSAPSFLNEFFRSPEYKGSGLRGCLMGNPVKEICTINLTVLS